MGERADNLADIGNRFGYHPPQSQEAKDGHEQMRAVLATAAGMVAGLVPPGREQSLAITKLEEAMFWANAGIARNQPRAST